MPAPSNAYTLTDTSEIARTQALMDALFPDSASPNFLPPPPPPKPRKGSFLNIKSLHLRGRTDTPTWNTKDPTPTLAASINPTITTSLSPASIPRPLTPAPLPPLPPLCFRGQSSTECEDFLHDVRQRAFALEKQNDPEWMLQLATASFSGEALRWLLTLDLDTQDDWPNLQLAMLEHYSDAAIIPVPAAAPTPGRPLLPTFRPEPMKKTGHLVVYQGETRLCRISKKPTVTGGLQLDLSPHPEPLLVRWDESTLEVLMLNIKGSRRPIGCHWGPDKTKGLLSTMRAEFWTDVLIPPASFILLPSGRLKVVYKTGAKELLADRTGATAFLDLRVMLHEKTLVFTQDVDGDPSENRVDCDIYFEEVPDGDDDV